VTGLVTVLERLQVAQPRRQVTDRPFGWGWLPQRVRSADRQCGPNSMGSKPRKALTRAMTTTITTTAALSRTGRRTAMTPSRLLRLHYDWWLQQLGPVYDRVRTKGILRAAPASMLLAAATLVVTGLVRLATPLQHNATALLSYRGEDLYDGELWKVPLSGLLAQSWPQWVWTLFVAAVVFAPLEVRAGARKLLACVFLSQIVSTSAVALLAPTTGHADLLSRADYGTSCLVVGAAAALTWVRRSMLLAFVITLSLAFDAFLSAPSTAVEHCIAVAVGALVLVAAKDGRLALCSHVKEISRG
jgi:membrane associated rhomboid family serine protease